MENLITYGIYIAGILMFILFIAFALFILLNPKHFKTGLFGKIVLVSMILGSLIYIIDCAMIGFGTRKYYEISFDNKTINDSLSTGVFVMGNEDISIPKWEITSIKEVKNKPTKEESAKKTEEPTTKGVLYLVDGRTIESTFKIPTIMSSSYFDVQNNEEFYISKVVSFKTIK